MILFQIKLTMWCWAIDDWVTDFFLFFFGLRFVVFRWMGLKDSLNFGCKFFFQWMGYSGLTTVVLQMRPDE